MLNWWHVMSSMLLKLAYLYSKLFAKCLRFEAWPRNSRCKVSIVQRQLNHAKYSEVLPEFISIFSSISRCWWAFWGSASLVRWPLITRTDPRTLVPDVWKNPCLEERSHSLASPNSLSTSHGVVNFILYP